MARCLECLRWLLPQCEKFPKAQRFVVTARCQAAALNFQERLVEANAQAGQARLALLRQADAELNKLRLYLRLAHDFDWLSPGAYEHGSRMVAELGRLLGGWLRQTEGRAGVGGPAPKG